jgi:Fe2+ transport system protein FeoA
VDDLIPLEMLRPGQLAVVGEIVGQAEHVVRLEELGLRSGRAVEMVQAGSPCIIRVDGHKLCFRDGECFSVLVRLGAAE